MYSSQVRNVHLPGTCGALLAPGADGHNTASHAIRLHICGKKASGWFSTEEEKASSNGSCVHSLPLADWFDFPWLRFLPAHFLSALICPSSSSN